MSYNNIGVIYKSKGDLDKALEYYNLSLDIRNRLSPNSLDVAMSYNNIGSIYYSHGYLDKALEFYNLSFEIRNRLSPNSLDVVTSYNNIGSIYYSHGDLDKAMEYCNLSIEIYNIESPNSLSVANSYNNIGNICNIQGNIDKALEYYNLSLEIYNRLSPNSLSVASSYNNIGLIWKSRGDFNKALELFNKSLIIRNSLAPNSLDISSSYYNIGMLYHKEKDFKQAYDLLFKSYIIRVRDLIPTHPNLLTTAYYVSLSAYELYLLEEAMQYADICVRLNIKYKFAYLLKSQIFVKLDELENALESVNASLSLDLSYADAKLKRLEVLTLLAVKNNDINLDAIIEEAKQAELIPKSDFDDKLKEELQSQGERDTKVEFPKSQFTAGDDEYITKLRVIAQQLVEVKIIQEQINNRLDISDSRQDKTENRVDTIEVKVSYLEFRLNILNDKVYEISHSIDTLNRDLHSIFKMLTDFSTTAFTLSQLKLEREKIENRKKTVYEFYKITDLRHYYQAILSEISAIYISAQVIGSKQVDFSSQTTYTNAANFLANFASLLPIIGQLSSKLISSVGSFVDMYQTTINENSLMRIRNFASTVEEFDQIAVRIAIEFTLANRERIIKLDGAKVPKDWSSYLSSAIDNGVQGLLTKFLADNDTQAKLLGRTHGQFVITYLQEESTAENLKFVYENADNPSHEQLSKSRPSIIASFLYDEVSSRYVSSVKFDSNVVENTKHSQIEFPDTNTSHTQARCCVLM